MSKKIIEVPEGVNSLLFCVDIGDQIVQDEDAVSISDLPDYDEPRTADGLTLREFAIQCGNDCENVQFHNGIKWVDHCKMDAQSYIYQILFSDDDMSRVRIKPEPKVMHYGYYKNGGQYSFCDNEDCCIDLLTDDKDEVTCTECLKKLKYDWIEPGVKCFVRNELNTINDVDYNRWSATMHSGNDKVIMADLDIIFPAKYEPWTFDTAPTNFVCNNNLEWMKCSSKTGLEWGFVCLEIKKWRSFKYVFSNVIMKDGYPCGNPVQDTEYYKQFER